MVPTHYDLTATGAVPLPSGGSGLCRTVVSVTGTFVGTLNFTCHPQGTALTATGLGYTKPTTNTIATTDITAPGVFLLDTSGLVAFLNVSAYTSGTITVDAVGVNASS